MAALGGVQVRGLQTGTIRRVMVRLVLLAICYLVAGAVQVNHIVYTLMKGNYLFTKLSFTSAFFFGLSLILVPVKHSSARRKLVLSLSPLAGYSSRLFAFFLMLLRRGAGLARLLDIPDLSARFFLSPCFTFAWLVGFFIFTANHFPRLGYIAP